jgi:H+/Cl- antiporter ClcA
MPYGYGDLANLTRLLLLGLLVGLACWPLNLIDGAQARLLGVLPGISGGGWSGGDGEVLLKQVLDQRGPLPNPGSAHSIGAWLGVLLSRLLAPALVLAAGVPGGLIDPSLAVGGLFGGGILQLLGGATTLGVALGMAGALAGATQLPLISAVFALKLAGDQQWLLGIVVSSTLGAHAGRRLQAEPIYHALREPLREHRADRRE